MGVILFFAGFLVLLFLFSEEFPRCLAWLKTQLAKYPRYRIIAYPLLGLLLCAAGILIAAYLLELSATTFSYE